MLLLERETQLRELHRLAGEAQDGQGCFVLVAGEAGAGKSSLVEQFQRELGDGGGWTWSGCDGHSTPRPLAPLFDAADALGGRLRKLADAGAERSLLFRSLLEQLSTGDAPLAVFVIEDVHWADEATLELIRFLARRLRAAPVMLLVTYRNDEATPAPLRLLLGDLASLRWNHRLEVDSLTAAGVQTLAQDSSLDASELFALTGGNPFYVSEMIAAGTPTIPLSARDAVLARAARLSSDAARVMATASLVGTRVEPDILISATECGCRPDILDELVRSGLLIEDGTHLRFRHEIIRRAVEGQISAHRRPAIHGQVLAALLSAGSTDDARLAFHAEGANDGVKVLHHAAEAARRAAELGSHQEAAAQYLRALRQVSTAEPAVAAALYTGLAEEAALGDGWQMAADADEHALALWRALNNRVQEGDTLRRYSLALRNLCRGDESLATAEAAVRILEPLGPSRELAAAYGTLAANNMTRNENEKAGELAHRAREVAVQVGALDVVADSLNTEGCAMRRLGGDWVQQIRRALEFALSHNLVPQAGRAYNNLCSTLCDDFRFAEAEQYYRDGIAYCDEHNLGIYTFCLRATRSSLLRHRGQWNEAYTLAQQLLREGVTSPQTQICPGIHKGLIDARRGRAEAWIALDLAAAAAGPTREPQYIVPVHLARAEAHWLGGDDDTARFEVEQAVDHADGIDPWLRGSLDAWLRRTGSTRRVSGDIAIPHQLQRAGRHVEAAAAWDSLECPYDAALALLDSAEQASVQQALTRFIDLAAPAPLHRARNVLRALGARSIPTGPRLATRTHPLGLTVREHEVLELLAVRHTNAEIAQKLFISTKTVDHHVSAVLAKLGVKNRRTAASKAIRLGLTPTDMQTTRR